MRTQWLRISFLIALVATLIGPLGGIVLVWLIMSSRIKPRTIQKTQLLLGWRGRRRRGALRRGVFGRLGFVISIWSYSRINNIFMIISI